jgi:hypothetical protein
VVRLWALPDWCVSTLPEAYLFLLTLDLSLQYSPQHSGTGSRKKPKEAGPVGQRRTQAAPIATPPAIERSGAHAFKGKAYPQRHHFAGPQAGLVLLQDRFWGIARFFPSHLQEKGPLFPKRFPEHALGRFRCPLQALIYSVEQLADKVLGSPAVCSCPCNGVATCSLGTPHGFFQGLFKLAPMVTRSA